MQEYRLVLETMHRDRDSDEAPEVVLVKDRIFLTDEELYTANQIVEIATRVMKTLLEKRRDYGTANIRATGPTGVSIRLVDKVHRLYHLLSTGKAPENESVSDTWIDIVGYGIIGKILSEEGEW